MSKMYLYHQDYPKGKIFDSEFVAKKEDELRGDGWVDTPALLDLPDEKISLPTEVAENMAPDELVGMVKSMGYYVFTPDEFDAEVNKSVAARQSDADMITSDDDQMAYLEEAFYEDAESLNKDQLIEFGNTKYDLKLTKTMKESTLIEKIREAQEA